MSRHVRKPDASPPRDGLLCTHADIAAMWGISRARVHQIEQRALAKLRLALARSTEVKDWLEQQGLTAGN